MEHELLLTIIGLLVGTIGTLIGAGGGFLLMPYLLLVEKLPIEKSVGISLCVVLFNAIFGSLAYIKRKRIDYKSAFFFLISCIPGAIVGTSLTGIFSGKIFNFIFAFLLLLVVFRMFIGNEFLKRFIKTKINSKTTNRRLVDSNNNTYKYSFSLKKGIFLSFFVGVYSGLFGVGGGILHVPIMVGMLEFPIFIASPTSLFILIFTSLSSTIQNIILGRVDFHFAGFLIIGIIIGSQVGSFLSTKVNEKTLKVIVAILLVYTSFKMMI